MIIKEYTSIITFEGIEPNQTTMRKYKAFVELTGTTHFKRVAYPTKFGTKQFINILKNNGWQIEDSSIKEQSLI